MIKTYEDQRLQSGLWSILNLKTSRPSENWLRPVLISLWLIMHMYCLSIFYDKMTEVVSILIVQAKLVMT